MSIDIKEVTTIYSPFRSGRMKVHRIDKSEVVYITIADEDSTSAMRLNRAGLLELQGVIDQLLEVEK